MRAAGDVSSAHNVQAAVDAADHRRLHHTNLSVKTHPKKSCPYAFRSVPCESARAEPWRSLWALWRVLCQKHQTPQELLLAAVWNRQDGSICYAEGKRGTATLRSS